MNIINRWLPIAAALYGVGALAFLAATNAEALNVMASSLSTLFVFAGALAIAWVLVGQPTPRQSRAFVPRQPHTLGLTATDPMIQWVTDAEREVISSEAIRHYLENQDSVRHELTLRAANQLGDLISVHEMSLDLLEEIKALHADSHPEESRHAARLTDKVRFLISRLEDYRERILSQVERLEKFSSK